MEPGKDITAITRPGVYALLRKGHAVHIGRGRRMEERLACASKHRRGDYQPTLPRKPIEYDQILIWSCTVDEMEKVFGEVCEHYKWHCPGSST